MGTTALRPAGISVCASTQASISGREKSSLPVARLQGICWRATMS